jgi:hypothetical protein
MERYERVFDVIGWIGVLFLVPVGFYVFNYAPAVQFMQGKLGFVGRPAVLTLIAYALIALRIVFGGGNLVAPLLISFVVGFFLMATVVPFRFMKWFTDWARQLFFLDNKSLNFLAAGFVFFFGNLVSYARRASIFLQLILLLVLPVLVLVVANAFHLFRFPPPAL